MVMQTVALSARVLYPKIAERYESLLLSIALIYQYARNWDLQNRNRDLQNKYNEQGQEKHQLHLKNIDLKKQLKVLQSTEDPTVLEQNKKLMQQEIELKMRLAIGEGVEKYVQNILTDVKNHKESLKRQIAVLQPQYLSEEDIKKKEEEKKQENRRLVKDIAIVAIVRPFVSTSSCYLSFLCFGPVGATLAVFPALILPILYTISNDKPSRSA